MFKLDEKYLDENVRMLFCYVRKLVYWMLRALLLTYFTEGIYTKHF